MLCTVVFGQSGLANELQVSPFALYEQSSNNVIIDGVSSKFGLGVLGVGFEINLEGNIQVSAKLGYGKNNSQKMSFSGANFAGSVKGLYLEGAVEYTLLTRSNYTVFSQFRFINRYIDASDLKGSRNGLALTGVSHTTFDSVDLMLGAQMQIGSAAFVNISGGLSRWHLKSNAEANYAANGISATAKKRINAIGLDPILKIQSRTSKPTHNFSLELSYRPLKSVVDAEILAIQMEYTFHF
jgi:hypothetical protein